MLPRLSSAGRVARGVGHALRMTQYCVSATRSAGAITVVAAMAGGASRSHVHCVGTLNSASSNTVRKLYSDY